MNDTERSPQLGDAFDQVLRQLTGLPDTVKTSPATVTVLTPLLSTAQTWIVQTYRQRERGDIILVQHVDSTGGRRFVIPPEVADTIARQRDALTTKNRRRGARQAVETKRAKGIDPGAALARARRKRGGK